MKKINTILLYALLFLTWNTSTQAQKKGLALIDSLQSELAKAKEDTLKVSLLTQIGRAAIYISEFEKSMEYGNKALLLAEKANFKRGAGLAYLVMNISATNMGNYSEALKYGNAALLIFLQLNDKEQLQSIYTNIGDVYIQIGNYPEALKMFLIALKLDEEIGNKSWTAGKYNNIGIIYITQKNYPEALKYLSLAAKMYKELGDKEALNHPYNNMGAIFLNQGNYPEALKNFAAALKIREEMKDKKLIADSYSNIGNVYEQQKKYAEALDKDFASLKLYEEIGDKDGMSSANLNIGETNFSMKNYTEARHYFNRGLAINEEVGSVEGKQDGYNSLAELDSATGNYKNSLSNYKMYIIYRDSLYNEDNAKKMVAAQMRYDFDKKEDSTKAEQDRKDALAKKASEKQKLVRNGFIGGFAFVLLFAGVFFIQRNKIEKGKKLSDELLLNILPAETAEELKATGTAAATGFDEVTVLFTDFKDFTQASEKLTAHELVREINFYFSEFDKITSKCNIEKIKTIGDSYMAAGGLPVANKTNAVDTVTAALEIQAFIQQMNEEKQKEGRPFFEIRIGIHTGPVVAGIVGIKKFAYDIWGDTVNIASRMESSGEEGKVNISGSTYELVKDKFKCSYRGKIQAKNKGDIDMYFVEAIF